MEQSVTAQVVRGIRIEDAGDPLDFHFNEHGEAVEGLAFTLDELLETSFPSLDLFAGGDFRDDEDAQESSVLYVGYEIGRVSSAQTGDDALVELPFKKHLPPDKEHELQRLAAGLKRKVVQVLVMATW